MRAIGKIDHHGYLAVVAWCLVMGSMDYYIQWQCDLAEKEGAPKDAIYKAHSTDPAENGSSWHVVSGIQLDETRERVEQYIEELKKHFRIKE